MTMRAGKVAKKKNKGLKESFDPITLTNMDLHDISETLRVITAEAL